MNKANASKAEAVPLQQTLCNNTAPLQKLIFPRSQVSTSALMQTQSPEVAPCRLPVAFRQCCVSRDWYRVCTMQLLTRSTAKGLPEQVSALWLSLQHQPESIRRR